MTRSNSVNSLKTPAVILRNVSSSSVLLSWSLIWLRRPTTSRSSMPRRTLRRRVRVDLPRASMRKGRAIETVLSTRSPSDGLMPLLGFSPSTSAMPPRSSVARGSLDSVVSGLTWSSTSSSSRTRRLGCRSGLGRWIAAWHVHSRRARLCASSWAVPGLPRPESVNVYGPCSSLLSSSSRSSSASMASRRASPSSSLRTSVRHLTLNRVRGGRPRMKPEFSDTCWIVIRSDSS